MSTAIVSTTDVWTNWGQQLLILLEILFLVHQVDFFIPRGHGIAAFHEMNAFCLSGNLSPLEVNDFSAMTICHFPSIAYGGFLYDPPWHFLAHTYIGTKEDSIAKEKS